MLFDWKIQEEALFGWELPLEIEMMPLTLALPFRIKLTEIKCKPNFIKKSEKIK